MEYSEYLNHWTLTWNYLLEILRYPQIYDTRNKQLKSTFSFFDIFQEGEIGEPAKA